MIESNKTKRIDTDTFYAWTQEEFCNINQHDTEILGDLEDVGKTTSETEQSMMAYFGGDDDEQNVIEKQRNY
jgi:hypothetical protein